MVRGIEKKTPRGGLLEQIGRDIEIYLHICNEPCTEHNLGWGNYLSVQWTVP